MMTAFGSAWASDEYAGICVGYIECDAKCACSDPVCVGHCLDAVPADCSDALSGVSTCLAQQCNTPCNQPGDAG
jgi:hypothetical protein